MRLRLLAFISLIWLTIAMPIIAQRSPKPMKPTISQDIQDLKNRRSSLQSQSDALEGKQDFWHRAAIIAGFIAAGVALFAGAAQHVESKRGYALRGINKDLNEVDGRVYTLQIEREKTARVELLKTLAYRSLNNLQIYGIRGATIAYKDVPLDIVFCPTDPEVNQFAGSIANAFTAWKPTAYGVFRSTSRGLTIQYDPNDPRAAAAALHFFEALRPQGFRVNGPFPTLPSDPLELSPGPKPTAHLRVVVGERDPPVVPMAENLE